MANNTRGPRGRSRKPRPAAGSKGAAGERHAARPADAGEDPPVSRRRDRAGGRRVPAYRDFDDRPRAPWHPLPLSELLILAGAVAFAVAMARLGDRSLSATAPLLVAGVLAVGLGTAEVSWREHRSGFRSHTLLLAFVPVLALHSAVVLGYSALASPSRALNLAMLAVDVAVFALLARRLRASFANARATRR